MTKTCFLVTALVIALAAHAQAPRNQNFIQLHAGYGTETNIGYYGFFAGFSSERTHRSKLSSEMAISYFDGHGDLTYTNATEDYKALFAVPKIGLLIIGNNASFFHTRLSAGPAMKYYYNREIATMYVRSNPDGSQSVREPVTYSKEQRIAFSLYGGLDFSFRFSDKVKASLFLDTYSREIALEHFMPGIKVGLRL